MRLRTSFACLCLALACPLFANTGNIEDLATKYENFLLFQTSDYEISETAKTEFEDFLLPKFRRAVRDASMFSFERRGELAYFVSNLGAEEEETDEQRRARERANSQFHRLFNLILPTLAYAYRTPGTDEVANPYYLNAGVAMTCRSILDYSYSRGLTEDAWLPDHAGNASSNALEAGLVRTSGDLSEVSLRLGGYIQAVFLLRDTLEQSGVLAKYRAVVRNLVVNHGTMHGAFFHIAREEAGISHGDPFPMGLIYNPNQSN